VVHISGAGHDGLAIHGERDELEEYPDPRNICTSSSPEIAYLVIITIDFSKIP
jgi:hypothetical protein